MRGDAGEAVSQSHLGADMCGLGGVSARTSHMCGYTWRLLRIEDIACGRGHDA